MTLRQGVRDVRLLQHWSRSQRFGNTIRYDCCALLQYHTIWCDGHDSRGNRVNLGKNFNCQKSSTISPITTIDIKTCKIRQDLIGSSRHVHDKGPDFNRGRIGISVKAAVSVDAESKSFNLDLLLYFLFQRLDHHLVIPTSRAYRWDVMNKWRRTGCPFVSPVFAFYYLGFLISSPEP